MCYIKKNHKFITKDNDSIITFSKRIKNMTSIGQVLSIITFVDEMIIYNLFNTLYLNFCLVYATFCKVICLLPCNISNVKVLYSNKILSK